MNPSSKQHLDAQRHRGRRALLATMGLTASAPALAHATTDADTKAIQHRRRRREILRDVLTVATHYAKSVGHLYAPIPASLVIPLVPYDFEREESGSDWDMRGGVRYAVLWWGDVGQNGGSRSTSTHLAMVRWGTAAYVDPRESSPVVAFHIPSGYVDRVLRFSRNELVLEGRDAYQHFQDRMPADCDTRIVYRLRRQATGGWETVSTQPFCGGSGRRT